MLLTIDSGRDQGWAIFDFRTKNLLACGLGQPPLNKSLTRVVIERPHTGRTRARKRDVLTLAVRAGETGGVVKHVTGLVPEYIEPQKWKGSVPKEICHARIEAKLRPEELKLLPPTSSKRHNVLDAVGIGLYVLKR